MSANEQHAQKRGRDAHYRRIYAGLDDLVGDSEQPVRLQDGTEIMASVFGVTAQQEPEWLYVIPFGASAIEGWGNTREEARDSAGQQFSQEMEADLSELADVEEIAKVYQNGQRVASKREAGQGAATSDFLRGWEYGQTGGPELSSREIQEQFPEVTDTDSFANGMNDALAGDTWRHDRITNQVSMIGLDPELGQKSAAGIDPIMLTSTMDRAKISLKLGEFPPPGNEDYRFKAEDDFYRATGAEIGNMGEEGWTLIVYEQSRVPGYEPGTYTLTDQQYNDLMDQHAWRQTAKRGGAMDASPGGSTTTPQSPGPPSAGEGRIQQMDKDEDEDFSDIPNPGANEGRSSLLGLWAMKKQAGDVTVTMPTEDPDNVRTSREDATGYWDYDASQTCPFDEHENRQTSYIDRDVECEHFVEYEAGDYGSDQWTFRGPEEHLIQGYNFTIVGNMDRGVRENDPGPRDEEMGRMHEQYQSEGLWDDDEEPMVEEADGGLGVGQPIISPRPWGQRGFTSGELEQGKVALYENDPEPGDEVKPPGASEWYTITEIVRPGGWEGDSPNPVVRAEPKGGGEPMEFEMIPGGEPGGIEGFMGKFAQDQGHVGEAEVSGDRKLRWGQDENGMYWAEILDDIGMVESATLQNNMNEVKQWMQELGIQPPSNLAGRKDRFGQQIGTHPSGVPKYRYTMRKFPDKDTVVDDATDETVFEGTYQEAKAKWMELNGITEDDGFDVDQFEHRFSPEGKLANLVRKTAAAEDLMRKLDELGLRNHEGDDEPGGGYAVTVYDTMYAEQAEALAQEFGATVEQGGTIADPSQDTTIFKFGIKTAETKVVPTEQRGDDLYTRCPFDGQEILIDVDGAPDGGGYTPQNPCEHLESVYNDMAMSNYPNIVPVVEFWREGAKLAQGDTTFQVGDLVEWDDPSDGTVRTGYVIENTNGSLKVEYKGAMGEFSGDIPGPVATVDKGFVRKLSLKQARHLAARTGDPERSDLDGRAGAIWTLLDENEKAAISFGMSPSWVIEEDLGGRAPGWPALQGDELRQISVKLMDMMNEKGTGMIAKKAQQEWMEEDTGGGCVAYVLYEEDDSYWLITHAEDCIKPEPGDPAVLGRYSPDHGEPIGTWDLGSWTGNFPDLNRYRKEGQQWELGGDKIDEAMEYFNQAQEKGDSPAAAFLDAIGEVQLSMNEIDTFRTMVENQHPDTQLMAKKSSRGTRNLVSDPNRLVRTRFGEVQACGG